MSLRLLLAAAVATTAIATSAAPASAQTRAEIRRWEQAQARFEAERRLFERERAIFDQARTRGPGWRGPGGPGPGYNSDRWRTDYDAARYYRDDPRYTERVLGPQDQVYRGSDGRYYCRRNDGTTGLIVGGAIGGIFGNVIDGGRNRAGGTLIGGALGALLGREIDRNNDPVRCR